MQFKVVTCLKFDDLSHEGLIDCDASMVGIFQGFLGGEVAASNLAAAFFSASKLSCLQEAFLPTEEVEMAFRSGDILRDDDDDGSIAMAADF